LVRVSSGFLPDVQSAAGLTLTNRLRLAIAPPVSARQAVANALTNLGERVTVEDVRSSASPSPTPQRKEAFTASPLARPSCAVLVWLPMNRWAIRLCWSVSFITRATREDFRSLVDAQTGEVLVRHTVSSGATDATYRVYVGDSPAPMTPGLQSPSTAQPAVVDRQLLVLPALSAVASPSGWIPYGQNQTAGNNVIACSNPDAQDPRFGPLPDSPQGSPPRVFDFPLNLSEDPSNYTNASVANLFYWCNWAHDRLYELGFTEAAGNWQTENSVGAGRKAMPCLPMPSTARRGVARTMTARRSIHRTHGTSSPRSCWKSTLDPNPRATPPCLQRPSFTNTRMR
jgi:hypothetical protein